MKWEGSSASAGAWSVGQCNAARPARCWTLSPQCLAARSDDRSNRPYRVVSTAAAAATDSARAASRWDSERQDLEYAESRAEGETEDREEAQGTADLLVLLGLYQLPVVSGFGQALVAGSRCWFRR